MTVAGACATASGGRFSGTGVGLGVAVGVTVGAGVGVAVGVAVGVTVGLAEGAGLALGVITGVGMSVGVAVGPGASVGVAEGGALGVGVTRDTLADSPPPQALKTSGNSASMARRDVDMRLLSSDRRGFSGVERLALPTAQCTERACQDP
jgi:hypothetical protein